MSSHIHTIMYISSGVPDLEETEIQNILNYAKNNNNLKDISGFLIFDQGNFIQLLEGKANLVVDLFDKIQQDQRHRNIIPVLNQKMDFKGFDFYHSGFKVSDNSNLLSDLKEYVAILKTVKEPQLKKTINLVDAILEAV
ncbi:MAG: BLUF domain-containing protein [Leeuwenhoekiella sp.]